jgi:hypothetical protein
MFNEIKIIDSSDTNVKKFVFEKENAVAEQYYINIQHMKIEL